ncbi:hypothetical protein QOZ80_5BG0448920 [Eleusine coracana subsp. coracana]|nr:hypothetical protein QOZ80_5BG0448920 [Eleusine coracana subsp. coracana]
MPRKKVEMKLIEDLSKRKMTFKNRSDGLIKKTEEISILCGCDALCICYDPTAASSSSSSSSSGGGAKTWPADPEKVQKLIRRYRDVPADRFRQVLTPLTFNEEELKKEQTKVIKVQQCGAGKLGLWDSSFDDASTDYLNAVLRKLDETMHKVQQRMAALGLLVPNDDMIVPALLSDDAAVFVAEPVPHAMSLPDNAFNFNLFGGSGSFPDTTAGSMVTTTTTTQCYNIPQHDHQMLPPQQPLQTACHGGYHQMPPPYLSCYQYQMMPPPYLSCYQMPPSTTLLGPPPLEFCATPNGASAAPEFYNDVIMESFDAGGGAYVSDVVLGQAFSAAGSPTAGGIWPGSTTDNQTDGGAAFQYPLSNNNDFDDVPHDGTGSASGSSGTSFQGGFQN